MLFLPLPGCAAQPGDPRIDAKPVAESPESKLGAKSFRRFLSNSDVIISDDSATRDRVLRVFVRLVDAAKRSQYADAASRLSWEHVVIRNDQKVTAVAFPGGKIGLYTGLVSAAESDDQLAAAVGHLVAKVLIRQREEEQRVSATQPAAQNESNTETSSSAPAEEAEKTRKKSQREEADYLGMVLSAEAGYDPQGAVALYKRLEGQNSPRAKKLAANLGDAVARYQANKDGLNGMPVVPAPSAAPEAAASAASAAP